MHPTLARFAARYGHAFPDLTVTEDHRKQELCIEWQEAPTSPCYTVTIRQTHYGPAVVVETGVFVVTDGDILKTLVYVMARERGLSARGNEPLLAAPGTFAALVLERRLLSGVRPQSPDRLN